MQKIVRMPTAEIEIQSRFETCNSESRAGTTANF